MLKNFLEKTLISILTISIICGGFFVSMETAYSVGVENKWNSVDKKLVQKIREVHSSSEEFANAELDDWVEKVMRNVDSKFLDWYYNYVKQKTMEFGTPFAWVFFKIDEPLKVFRNIDEKELNAGDLIQKRMIKDFNQKFNDVVFDDEFERDLKSIIERISRNHSLTLAVKFSEVKNDYNVSDQEWKNHLGKFSKIVYDTGDTQLSKIVYNTGDTQLSKIVYNTGDTQPETLNSDLLTKTFTLTTFAIGGKVAAKFAVKAGGKFAVKAGASVLLKQGIQAIDPVLGVGFLVWDVWDYKNMVSKNRPEMRQNILDYLNELKGSILYGYKNSIITALDEVESKLIDSLNRNQN